MPYFFGDLKSDTQAKVDENLRLAGAALATNNLRNAEQFAQAALNTNAAMSSVDVAAYTTNNQLIGNLLNQIAAAKNPPPSSSPPANTNPDTSSNQTGMISKTKIIIGLVALVIAIGVGLFLVKR